MMRKVEQTDEEIIKMYMDCEKELLAKMLLQCNKLLTYYTKNVTIVDSTKEKPVETKSSGKYSFEEVAKTTPLHIQVNVLEQLCEIDRKEIEKLQAFKDYVHRRLDEAGIEKEPDGEHSKAGCRIGDRLDIVLTKHIGTMDTCFERDYPDDENMTSEDKQYVGSLYDIYTKAWESCLKTQNPQQQNDQIDHVFEAIDKSSNKKVWKYFYTDEKGLNQHSGNFETEHEARSEYAKIYNPKLATNHFIDAVKQLLKANPRGVEKHITDKVKSLVEEAESGAKNKRPISDLISDEKIRFEFMDVVGMMRYKNFAKAIIDNTFYAVNWKESFEVYEFLEKHNFDTTNLIKEEE